MEDDISRCIDDILLKDKLLKNIDIDAIIVNFENFKEHQIPLAKYFFYKNIRMRLGWM